MIVPQFLTQNDPREDNILVANGGGIGNLFLALIRKSLLNRYKNSLFLYQFLIFK